MLVMEMISLLWEDSGTRNYRTGFLTHMVSNEQIEERKNQYTTPTPSGQEAVGRVSFLYPLCYKIHELLTTTGSVRLLHRRRQGQIAADQPFPAKQHYKQSKTSSASMIQASEQKSQLPAVKNWGQQSPASHLHTLL